MAHDKYSEHNYKQFVNIIKPALKGKDATRVADVLIERYGSIENVMSADRTELCELVGEGVAVYIKVLGAVTSRRYTADFELGARHTRAQVAEYFKALFLSESVECVYAMLLGDDGEALDTKLISRGTVNSSDVIPRRILEAAIDGNSHRVILAHNHPHGLAKASEDDVRLTTCVADVLSLVGIKLEYHLVIAGVECDVVSFKGVADVGAGVGKVASSPMR